MKKYYLAYGSNLNLEQMAYRCKRAKPIGTTKLKDHRLVFKGTFNNYAYLTIEKTENIYVPLGIYEISFFDELSLNRFEGYPKLYHKEYIPIIIDGKEEKALIYIMNNQFDYHLPSKEYLLSCIKGYEHFNFDKNILIEALDYSTKKASKKLLKKRKEDI